MDGQIDGRIEGLIDCAIEFDLIRFGLSLVRFALIRIDLIFDLIRTMPMLTKFNNGGDATENESEV